MAKSTEFASRTDHIDAERIPQAAAEAGQYDSPALSPPAGDEPRKTAPDQACPVSGGKSTACHSPDAERSGRTASRTCKADSRTGEGIETGATFAGCKQDEAAHPAGDRQSSESKKSETAEPDVIELVCRDKCMPREAFEQFGVTVVKRGRNGEACARVSVYDERGEIHSHLDFIPGKKGCPARGKESSGMFFPGRLPVAGETWLLAKRCEDAAALVGLGFNAAGLPASRLAEKYSELFRNVHVVLVPDLDKPGQGEAQRSGGKLNSIAATVGVVRLPGEITKTNGKGIRNVLALAEGEKLARDAIAAAKPWQPKEGAYDSNDGMPEVRLTLKYGLTTDEVLSHLGRLGWDTPWIPKAKRERLKLYHRSGSLVHVVIAGKDVKISGGTTLPAGTARIRQLPVGQLPLRISDAMKLFYEKEADEGVEIIDAPPPKWLIDGVFTRGDFSEDFRRLEAIITAPTLRADGTILQRAGYDESTALLYIPNDKFPPVPENPTIEDAKRAAAELLEVVKDFEFIADADRSAWLAMVLSQIGRQAIAGCVPLFGITATTRGSGKSLLADAASLIAFGCPAARKPYSPNDDEQRKSITAIALEALPAVLLDNVDRRFGGSQMDAALTALSWNDRVLGESRTTGDLPMRTVWSATGNNLGFVGDFARRVLLIRLAPTMENPEERTDFAHVDLLGWVRQNRPRLAVAALTLLRAYFKAGRPVQSDGTWGSFESWSAVVRGAIVWAGLADPLPTRETAKADDASGAVVRGLIAGLQEMDEHGDGMLAREIVSKLNDPAYGNRYPAMREAVAEVATHRGAIDHQRLGYVLRKYRGRIADGFQLVGVPGRGGVLKWSAVRHASSVPGGGGDGGDGGDGFEDPHVEACVFESTDIQGRSPTHSHLNEEGLGVSQPSQPSQPHTSGQPRCDHDYVEVQDGEMIKTECRRCGKFYGRRPGVLST